MKLGLIFASSLLACVVGCSTPSGGVAGEGPPAKATRSAGVAIATMVTHDAKVTILGRGGDLRFVVRDAEGVLVADGETLDELAKRDPELHELVTSALARQGGTFLDARLDTPVDRGSPSP